jgi:hypothetical protein
VTAPLALSCWLAVCLSVTRARTFRHRGWETHAQPSVFVQVGDSAEALPLQVQVAVEARQGVAARRPANLRPPHRLAHLTEGVLLLG